VTIDGLLTAVITILYQGLYIDEHYL